MDISGVKPGALPAIPPFNSPVTVATGLPASAPADNVAAATFGGGGDVSRHEGTVDVCDHATSTTGSGAVASVPPSPRSVARLLPHRWTEDGCAAWRRAYAYNGCQRTRPSRLGVLRQPLVAGVARFGRLVGAPRSRLLVSRLLACDSTRLGDMIRAANTLLLSLLSL